MIFKTLKFESIKTQINISQTFYNKITDRIIIKNIQ